ncbi:MAG: (d)CMP kinase [Parachlamydiales bacterium]|nr:(d)CMP kinase [Parachlamydiales bacterium]
MIITIDGPAGTGKSTIAKLLSKILEFDVFDTGAMYRAFTWYLLEKKIEIHHSEQIERALNDFFLDIHKDEQGDNHYFVESQEITQAIRSKEVTEVVSQVSALEVVRKNLVKLQRAFGKKRNAVFEGRDMGSVVFPHADLKFFLTATPEVRALRRYRELLAKFPDHKDSIQYQKIFDEIQLRDHRDSTRKLSPLLCPSDAYLIDTTEMSIEEVLDAMIDKGRKKLRSFLFPRTKMRGTYRNVLRFFSFLFCWRYHFYLHGRMNIPRGASILAANHSSYFDPPAVAISFSEEIHFLGKKALFKIPIFSSIIKHLNTHPVSGKAGDAQTIKEIIKLLRSGKKVLVFPEGGRGISEKIREMLPGVGFLSYMTKVPIVPIYIQGTRQIWPTHKMFPRCSGSLHCYIGKPIVFAHDTHLDKKETLKAIDEELQTALRTLQGLAK